VQSKVGRRQWAVGVSRGRSAPAFLCEGLLARREAGTRDTDGLGSPLNNHHPTG